MSSNTYIYHTYVLDVLFLDKISQDINIAVSTLISCENVMIRDDDDTFPVPHLYIGEEMIDDG